MLHEQNMDVKVVVLNNSILGWIKWYEAAMWDGRFTEVDTETIDYAAVAMGAQIVKAYPFGTPGPFGKS